MVRRIKYFFYINTFLTQTLFTEFTYEASHSNNKYAYFSIKIFYAV